MSSDAVTGDGVRCMMMRGGTSKGGYFLAGDMPESVSERDSFLLSLMGSPDIRQIDGLGGAHPLTSKVGICEESANGSSYIVGKAGMTFRAVSGST